MGWCWLETTSFFLLNSSHYRIDGKCWIMCLKYHANNHVIDELAAKYEILEFLKIIGHNIFISILYKITIN